MYEKNEYFGKTSTGQREDTAILSRQFVHFTLVVLTIHFFFAREI